MKFRNSLLIVLLLAAFQPAQAQFGYAGPGNNNNSAVMSFLRYMNARANGKNLKGWWKSEVTLGYSFSQPMSYTYYRQYYPEDYTITNDPLIDSTVTGKAMPEFGYHFQGSGDHLLVRISNNSIVSFSFSVLGNYQRYSAPDLDQFTTLNGQKGTVTVMKMGFPLTLEYKLGADVDWKPDQRTSFAVGGGVLPALTAGDVNTEYQALKFNAAPVVYASVGFFAGVLFKVRASYTPGYGLFNEATGYNTNLKNTFTAAMPGTFHLGIGLMTYSWDWRHGQAWRTGLKGERSKGNRSRSSYGVMRMY